MSLRAVLVRTALGVGLLAAPFAGAAGETLWGFGSGRYGELGDGHTVEPVYQRLIGAMPMVGQAKVVQSGIRSAATGAYHSLFLRTDGTLWGVGNNDFGQLGDGSTYARWNPVQLAGGVEQVSAGQAHTLFLRSNGELWATGNNSLGQLGDGTTADRARPVRIAGSVTALAAGWRQSYYVTAGRTLWACGDNQYGQLGDGTVVSRSLPVIVATDVVGVAAGEFHGLFLKSDGSVWAMGNNGAGQLGDGTTTNRLIPVRVTDGVAKIAAGGRQSFVIRTDGSLWGFGDNSNGQLGDGTTSNRSAPSKIADGVGSVSTARNNTMFVKTDGALFGMGWNSNGQLGDGSYVERRAPVPITAAVAQTYVGFRHSLFVDLTGRLWGCGLNEEGQLATGTTSQRWIPAAISDDVIAMSCGAGATYFIKSDGTLWGTGANSVGQLGDGTTTWRSSPVLCATHVTAVDTGLSSGHVVFLKTDGSLWGMGRGAYGQLGDGKINDLLPRTTPIKIADGVVSMAAGGDHTVFIKNDQTLWGTGYGSFGQLGESVGEHAWSPVQIATQVVHVAVGRYSTMYVKSDGSLWGMGDGLGGKSPRLVAQNVAKAFLGESHQLFLKRDATLWAMGSPIGGTYDSGTILYSFSAPWSAEVVGSSEPVQIASDVKTAAAGYSTTFFLKLDGSLWARGFNSDAQVCDGTTLEGHRYRPVQIAEGVSDIQCADYHGLFLGGRYVGAAPAISGIWEQTIQAGDSTGALSIYVKDADTAPEALTISASTSNPDLLPVSGVAVVGEGAQRVLQVRPAPGKGGVGQVTLTVSDGKLTDSMTFKVTVRQPITLSAPVADRAGAVGGNVELRVDVSGYPAPEFYWGYSANGGASFVAIKDDDTFSGSRTATLRISGAPAFLNGVIFSCTAYTYEPLASRSSSGVLTLHSPTGAEPQFGTPPADASVTTTTACSFEVGAVRTTSWRWQVAETTRWVDVPDAPPYAGVTTTRLTVTNPSRALNGARYRCVATNASGAVTSAAATMTVTDAGSRFFALSTRAQVGAGSGVLIPGFVITGGTGKRLLIRALGPKLREFGLSGELSDPKLQVTTLSGQALATNNDWSTTEQAVQEAGRACGLPDLTPGGKDAALIATLPPGVYTAIVSGVNDGTGVALVEFYDLDTNNGKLAAISARAQVGTGFDVLIPGIVIEGTAPKRLLIRVGGPQLAQYFSGFLADPQFEVKNAAGTTILSNDNWDPTDTTLVTTTAAVGAPPFQPGSKDAALVAELTPGLYTIVIRGVANTSGVALIELFDVP